MPGHQRGDEALDVFFHVRPRELAQEIARATAGSGFEPPEVAGPGFINFRLKSDARLGIIARVLSEGPRYLFEPDRREFFKLVGGGIAIGGLIDRFIGNEVVYGGGSPIARPSVALSLRF